MAMYESQGNRQEQGRQQQFAGQQGQQAGQQGQQGQQAGQQGQSQRGSNVEHAVNLAEIAVRGTAVLFDIQTSALRSLLQLQARSVAAFGAPDYSDLLRYTDTGTKRLLSTGTEQVMNSVRQASDTITEVQRQFGRLVEQGTLQLTEDLRQGIQELSQRTQQGLQEVKNMAQESADEAEQRLRRQQSQQQQQAQQLQAQQAQGAQAPGEQAARPGQPQVDQPRPEEEHERAGKRRSA